MLIYVFVHINICRCICISIYLSFHLSIYLTNYLSIYPSIYQSVYQLIYPFIYLSIHLSIHSSIYLFIYQSSICLSFIHLSNHLPTYTSIDIHAYLQEVNCSSFYFYLLFSIHFRHWSALCSQVCRGERERRFHRQHLLPARLSLHPPPRGTLISWGCCHFYDMDMLSLCGFPFFLDTPPPPCYPVIFLLS